MKELLKSVNIRVRNDQNMKRMFFYGTHARLLYAQPVWSGFLSVELITQINSLLKRAYKYRFSTTKHAVENMANETELTKHYLTKFEISYIVHVT